MVQNYSDTWLRQSHLLDPLKEDTSGSKGTSIIWNNMLEVDFHEIKKIVSADTLLNYPYRKIMFTIHTYAFDQQLGAVISQNNKPIPLFLRKLRKTHRNYTTTLKAIILIVERLK